MFESPFERNGARFGGLSQVAEEGLLKSVLVRFAEAESERAQLHKDQVGFEEFKRPHGATESMRIAVDSAHQKKAGKDPWLFCFVCH
jgi:hypothetical protein